MIATEHELLEAQRIIAAVKIGRETPFSLAERLANHRCANAAMYRVRLHDLIASPAFCACIETPTRRMMIDEALREPAVSSDRARSLCEEDDS